MDFEVLLMLAAIKFIRNRPSKIVYKHTIFVKESHRANRDREPDVGLSRYHFCQCCFML